MAWPGHSTSELFVPLQSRSWIVRTGFSSQLWWCRAAVAGWLVSCLSYHGWLPVEEPRGETAEKLLLNCLQQVDQGGGGAGVHSKDLAV